MKQLFKKIELFFQRIFKYLFKNSSKWGRYASFLVAGLIIFIGGVALANPGNIVGKTLSAVGLKNDDTKKTDEVNQQNNNFEKKDEVKVEQTKNENNTSTPKSNTQNSNPEGTEINQSENIAKDKSCSSSTIKLGSQCWMKYNLNVGTMVNGSVGQSNNSVIEKHCYDNDPNNCATYGGLYQWDEMMQYSLAQSVQGICPAGYHIPSDNEWKILEIYLGMTQAQADGEGNRGTDQGAKMLSGGSSGLNFPISGYSAGGSFYGINFRTWIWSSTQSDGSMAWHRGPQWGQISRDRENKIVGAPVRCIQNM